MMDSGVLLSLDVHRNLYAYGKGAWKGEGSQCVEVQMLSKAGNVPCTIMPVGQEESFLYPSRFFWLV